MTATEVASMTFNNLTVAVDEESPFKRCIDLKWFSVFQMSRDIFIIVKQCFKRYKCFFMNNRF